MNLVVNVEFLAGTDITEAITEAKEFCNKHGTTVRFSFNGVAMFVSKTSDIDGKVNEYHESIGRKQR